MKRKPKVTIRSKGLFDPREWLDAGEGHLASADILREHWMTYREEFKQNTGERLRSGKDFGVDWYKLEGAPRSTILLVGYAAESFLKAGLVKLYGDCPEDVFRHAVKDVFGHDFVRMAEELGLALISEERSLLNDLRDAVVFDARYPIDPKGREDYARLVNERTKRMWDAGRFDKLCTLVERIRDDVKRINSDKSDLLRSWVFNIDDDGFCVARIGGGAPSRITYRASSGMTETDEIRVDDMKMLLEDSDAKFPDGLWEEARIIEIGHNENGRMQHDVRQYPDKRADPNKDDTDWTLIDPPTS